MVKLMWAPGSDNEPFRHPKPGRTQCTTADPKTVAAGNPPMGGWKDAPKMLD